MPAGGRKELELRPQGSFGKRVDPGRARHRGGLGSLSPTIVDILPSIIDGPPDSGEGFAELTAGENVYSAEQSIGEIARILNVKQRAVDNRLSGILAKLDVANRREGAELSRTRGLRPSEEPESPSETG